MFQLYNTIVSEEILDVGFVCDLQACKGVCCVEGEAGAPVEPDERVILDRIYPVVKPYLTPEGVKAIESQGTYITNPKGEYETPLIDGGACAYVVFDERGIAGCGIEKAYHEGEVDFPKPVSCHLYPVRVTQYSHLTAVNYHAWSICNDACVLGGQRKIPVYRFVKDALIRRFGRDWYDELHRLAEEYYAVKSKMKR